MTIHEVQPGESVYGIAHLYNVPMERIISDNALRDPGRLVVGQSLIIRYPTQYHVVKPGDTLQAVANMHGLTLEQLYQMNPALGGRPDLVPGQSLVVQENSKKEGNLAVNAYVHPNADRTALRKTLPYLTYLSVFSYQFAPDGAITGPNAAEFVQLAREYKVVPLMVLTALDDNGTFSSSKVHDLLGNTELQNTLIENTARALYANGFEGVLIDFQYILPEDKALYADFIKRMTNRMNELGYSVTVAVAAKSSDTQSGLLFEGQDYELLGNAADNVQTMVFNGGTAYSAPKAVTSMQQLRSDLGYAEGIIDRERLFIGLPNYGYDWTLPYVAGQSTAQGIGNTEAVEQALQRNARIEYDWTSQSPHYTYWLNNQEHKVWFDDSRSFRAKLGTIAANGLRGVSIWSLMPEFPQLWLILGTLYNIEKRL